MSTDLANVPGGIGSSLSWQASELAYAQLLLGSTLTTPIVGDGLDTVKGTLTIPAVTYDERGGLVTTGAAPAGIAQAQYKLQSGLYLPGPGNLGRMYVSMGVQVVDATSGTTTIRIQITDLTADSLHFEINSAGATPTTWRVIGTRGGSAFNVAGTGILAALDVGSFHRFGLIMDGTTCFFQIDHTTIGSGPQVAGSLLTSCMQGIYFNGATGGAKRLITSQWFAAYPGLPTP